MGSVELAANAKFQIAGASDTSPIGIEAAGIEEFQPLLAFMVKPFTLGALRICAMNIEGDQATVHSQANVRLRITGATVLTK